MTQMTLSTGRRQSRQALSLSVGAASLLTLSQIAILVQTSMLAAIGGLNTATINPALVQIAKEFEIDVVRASYQT